MLCNEGKEFIDCVVINLPEEREKALNIALNKISGDWDYEKLAQLMQELKEKEIDLTITGFAMDEVEKLFSEQFPSQVEEDDFNLDEALGNIDEPATKPGDVWIIGKHKLVYRDSTLEGDVNKLMNDEKATGTS